MKPKYKRLIAVTALLVFMALGAVILLKTFSDNLVYYYSPSDLKERSDDESSFKKLFKKNIRVGGLIKSGSLKKEGADEINFIVTDNNYEIKIYYKGILPPMFREGQGVVAEGSLMGNIKIVQKTLGIKDKNKTDKSTIYQFKAKKLITKHDEKYMPPEVKKNLSPSPQ